MAVPSFSGDYWFLAGSVMGLATGYIGRRTFAAYNKTTVLGTAVFGQMARWTTTKVVNRLVNKPV